MFTLRWFLREMKIGKWIKWTKFFKNPLLLANICFIPIIDINITEELRNNI